MFDFPSSDLNQQRWNRILLNGYWCVIALSVLVELIYLSITKEPKGLFACHYILLPTAALAAVTGFAEIGIRFLPRQHDYMLISTSSLIAIVIILINSSEIYLLISLFFPVLVSLFYFRLKKLLFAFLNCFMSLAAVYELGDGIREELSLGQLAGILSIMLLFGAVSFGILLRGRELRDHLKASYESRQELLVHSIMMDKLAKTDALTDVYNHMAFQEYLERLVEQAETNGLPLQLAIADIDNFKHVNDAFGHRAGDAVLRKVGAILRDSVGSHDIVARYGGEELAVLFTNVTVQEAYDRADRIRLAVSHASQESLGGKKITVSVGVADYKPGLGKEAFFRQADAALYQAKRSGKNRTVLAGEKPAQQARSSLA